MIKKTTAIDLAKTLCDVFESCFRDKSYSNDTVINIEINRQYSNISVETVTHLHNGKTGHKQELSLERHWGDKWEDYTGYANRNFKAAGKFYDPDEQDNKER